MEIQLKELIDKIKEEGVGEADKQAQEIIQRAKEEALKILEKARLESDTIIQKATEGAKQIENAGREALKQAGRDMILNMKNVLTQIFNAIVREEVKASLSGDIIAEIIPVILEEWSRKSSDQVEVLLSQKDFKKLEKSLFGKLSSEMKKGIVIKPHPGIQSGFRIAQKDGNYYYDFTDEGIAENLVQYLNPVFSEIIREAAAGD